MSEERRGAHRLPARPANPVPPARASANAPVGTYGMTPLELLRHAHQLLDSGWSLEEIEQRLDLSALPALDCHCAMAQDPQQPGRGAA